VQRGDNFGVDLFQRPDGSFGFEEFRRRIFTAGTELLSNLLRASFFLEKLLLRFAGPSLSLLGAIRIRKDGVNNLRKTYQPLLIGGDEIQQGAVHSCSG